MASYRVITAATVGSLYVDCLAEHEARGAITVQLPNRGSWRENTKIKPEAIRYGFTLSPVPCVLWVDADCLLDPLPDGLPPGDWDVCTAVNCHPTHKIRVSASYLLLRDTPAAHAFLDMWDACAVGAKQDHVALRKALNCTTARVGDMTDWIKGRQRFNALRPERGAHHG